jgi:hypothetical protein
VPGHVSKPPQRFAGWENKGGVNLYYLPDEGRGFFTEVGMDDGRGQAVVLRSFSGSGLLEDYACYTQLSD